MNTTDRFSELMAYTLYFMKDTEVNQPSYDSIYNEFTKLIINSREQVKDDPYLFQYWEKALFAVCAWIDEHVLLSNWQNKELWQLNPLQNKYFKTRNAGEEFFEIMERLDPIADAPVIEVYNYCIKLGFKGKYFHPVPQTKLVESHNSDDSDVLLIDNVSMLFPRAYSNQERKKRRRSVRLSSEFILFLIALTLGLCLVLLGSFYQTILDNQVVRLFS